MELKISREVRIFFRAPSLFIIKYAIIYIHTFILSDLEVRRFFHSKSSNNSFSFEESGSWKKYFIDPQEGFIKDGAVILKVKH